MSIRPSTPNAKSDELEARVLHIEAMLEHLEANLNSVVPIATLAVDVVDDIANAAVERGVDPVARLHAISRLMEALSEPSAAATLEGVLQRVDRLTPLLEVLDELPGLVAMAVDIVDEAIGNAAARGTDINQAVQTGVKGFLKLGEFVLSPRFTGLLDSGMLDRDAVSLLGRVGRALADVAAEPNEAPSIFKMLRTSREQDVRRALNFAVRFSGRFGQLLQKQIGR